MLDSAANSPVKQIHIFVSGFVQGVGYRVFVRKNAQKLGLTGWVKNIPDRRVEAVIQGPEELLQQMVGILKKGPFLSEVKDLAIEWEQPIEEYNEMVILR